MRLFIAITLSGQVKDRLMETVDRLKSYAVRGSFTHRDNLHLTLVFIGETANAGRKNDIIEVMERISSAPFEITLEGLGFFKRDEGDIYWMGVRQNDTLAALQRQLCHGLERSGFGIDRREFRPHLTLGRRVILSNGFGLGDFSKGVPAAEVPVSRVSLMKSERISGRLIYTEVYAKLLEACPCVRNKFSRMGKRSPHA